MAECNSTVVSFVSGKGGVGKTVIASNIGKGLSLLGRKTVLIDLDFGLRNLDIALGVENNIVFDLSDVFSGNKTIKEILVEQLGVDEEDVTMDASFIDDLGADSLDIVELIMAMEEEFDIEISEEDAENISTVGSAIEYIKERQ